jgi:hypothetical protein
MIGPSAGTRKCPRTYSVAIMRPPREETDLRGQDDARQRGGHVQLPGLKAGRNQRDQLAGKYLADEHQARDDQRHEGGYHRKDLPRLLFLTAREVFGEYRHEGGGKRAAQR